MLQIYSPGTACFNDIVEAFGEDVLDRWGFCTASREDSTMTRAAVFVFRDRRIDRKVLGEKVFTATDAEAKVRAASKPHCMQGTSLL